jgi:type III secretion system HrpE/YscL family protein
MSLGLFHRTADREIRMQGSRIERQAFTALREADALLHDATLVAQRIREEAEAAAQALLVQARSEGFAQGRLEGMQAVIGTLALEERLRVLLADRLAGIVEQCVKSLLGDMGFAEAFKQRTRQLLRSATPAGGVTLHVHPAQAPLAREVVAEMAREHGAELPWLRIHADDHCADNTLVLETQVGFIDANVELTLEAARHAIAQAFAQAEQQLPPSAAVSAYR